MHERTDAEKVVSAIDDVADRLERALAKPLDEYVPTPRDKERWAREAAATRNRALLQLTCAALASGETENIAVAVASATLAALEATGWKPC